MTKQHIVKKHIVTSYRNLSPEMQEAVKAKYPTGFTDAMMRVDKPNGDFFYAVPFDTDEVAYLVKIDVTRPTTSRTTTPTLRNAATTTWKYNPLAYDEYYFFGRPVSEPRS